MEAIEKLKESGVAPEEFWYIATLFLTGILILFMGILIFFVKGFFADLKTTIKELVTSVTYLKDLATLHDSDIKHVKQDLIDAQGDIKELQKRRR